MKKRYLYLFLAPFLAFTHSCGKKCDEKQVMIGLMYSNYNDSLSIEIDNKLMFAKILKDSADEYGGFKKYKLFDICAKNDSILVRVNFNKKDTVFYFSPKIITQCYVGNSIKNEIHVYYSYRISSDK